MKGSSWARGGPSYGHHIIQLAKWLTGLLEACNSLLKRVDSNSYTTVAGGLDKEAMCASIGYQALQVSKSLHT